MRLPATSPVPGRAPACVLRSGHAPVASAATHTVLRQLCLRPREAGVGAPASPDHAGISRRDRAGWPLTTCPLPPHPAQECGSVCWTAGAGRSRPQEGRPCVALRDPVSPVPCVGPPAWLVLGALALTVVSAPPAGPGLCCPTPGTQGPGCALEAGGQGRPSSFGQTSPPPRLAVQRGCLVQAGARL